MPPAAPVYHPPAWLPGGHLQTIVPALLSRSRPRHVAAPAWRRQRWDTPDGDFIDVDWLDAPSAPKAPLLVLFHGLEGSSASHYVQAIATTCAMTGWRLAVPHFRGCSGQDNRAPRAYHSGDHEEIDWILARFAALDAAGSSGAKRFAAGVSLGGNALLRWAQEHGEAAAQRVDAIAAISAPLDLAAGARLICRGINHAIYDRMFLRTLKPKALRMIARHPGLADARRVRAARTLCEFDDAFTAPVHGFRDAADYWARAASRPHLMRLRVPALIVNARNDPMQPAAVLPGRGDVPALVQLDQPAGGGHVGFARGRIPGRLDWLPARLLHYFLHGN